MSRGVNKVILVGNLGRDPEVRYGASGNVVANLSIATSDQWRDKQSGEMQDRTEWHRVVMFNRLGEIARDYLHKGSQVYIEGSLQTRKWQDSSGQDRYSTEIIAREMQMLGGRGEGTTAYNEPKPSGRSPNGGGGYSGDRAPQQGGYTAPNDYPAADTPPGQQGGAPNSKPIDFNDDVPF